MRFLMLSLVFLMLQMVFNVFPLMFGKTSLLFCCFCTRLFVANYVRVVLFGVMRNLMLLFVSVCCYAKSRCCYSCPYVVIAEPRCYYSCPYVVLRNLDAIIRVSNYVRFNPGL